MENVSLEGDVLEGTLVDLTEHRHLEEQLRQSQKVEAIGRLAGGVAHDFNNLLGVITGYAELLLREIDRDDPRVSRVLHILRAAARAASLTHQLLAFGRKQLLEPKVLDLGDAVSEATKMLRRLIGEDIELSVVREAGSGRVKADPGQIEQVIANLILNARDAMPGGGRLTIETAGVALDAAYVRQHAMVRPGRYVMLAVSDTGSGMEAEVRERLFEPFFTTKQLGRGTGLGLATVYGIVKQSDGYIFVYSEVGRGTTFKVYLPRVDEPLAAEDASPAPLARGSETVLLVEDDPSLWELTKELLEASGYRVLAAADGAAALELSRGHKGVIDLLLTDVVMPGLTGRQLAEQLERERAGIAILYTSGYTDNVVARQGLLDSETALLPKPFTADALARKVREVLDTRPRP